MTKKILKATHFGVLNFGDVRISCAVLEDGTRVLVNRSMATAIGVKGGGQHWELKKHKSAELPEYISAGYLQPFISDDQRKKLYKTIAYEGKGGKETYGIEASILPEICDVWIKFGKNSAHLSPKKLRNAEKAYVMLKAFATVGITALVDEATGYQEVRDKQALAKILDAYLQDYARKWSKTFPDEFWDKLLKIKGYSSYIGMKRPSFVGHWVNDIVYDRLAPGVRARLKVVNPVTKSGHRKYKHHSHLTDDHGLPELKRLLSNVMVLMDAAANKTEFERLLNRSLPKYGDTIEMEV